MPFLAKEKLNIEQFFDEAFPNYINNLSKVSLSTANSDVKFLLRIELEKLNGCIWKGIKKTVLSYAEAVKNEQDILTIHPHVRTRQHMLELMRFYSAKDNAINEFATWLKKLSNECGISFTDPTKSYFFWGTDAGELQAYKDGYITKSANVVAAASESLFHILLGPLYFEGSNAQTVDFVFRKEQSDTPKYALQALLYPHDNVPKKQDLPDCSAMLWAVMSKIYADSAVDAVRHAQMPIQSKKILI